MYSNTLNIPQFTDYSKMFTLVRWVLSLDALDKGPLECGYIDVFKKRLKYIKNHTNEDIDIPFTILADVYQRNLWRGAMLRRRNIEIWGREFEMHELKMVLEDVREELDDMILKVAEVNEVVFQEQPPFDTSQYDVPFRGGQDQRERGPMMMGGV